MASLKFCPQSLQILKQKFQCPCDVIPVLDTGIQLLIENVV
ncbi:hypothetical protein [Wolbachia endosymbiont (group A) of Trypoxylon clavicerum]